MARKQTEERVTNFLMWFNDFYGGSTTSTVAKIAEDNGQYASSTVRVYMYELIRRGFIEQRIDENRRKTYVVNQEKIFEL